MVESTPPRKSPLIMLSTTSTPSNLLSLLSITALILQPTIAKPYPRELFSTPENATLEIRQCANPCGYVGLCCAATQQCYTDTRDQAQCGSMPATAGPGAWQLYTTTYVETDLRTITTTYSSLIAASPTVQTFAVTTTPASSNPVCNTALNEVSCGPICCAQGQFCQFSGQCAAIGGTTPGAGTPGIIPITPSATLSSASATGFVRPTSNTILTITSTGTATTTVPFQTPVASDGSAVTGMTVSTNNGLSGGAIAGIVIGVLLGIALLILFCVCCCAKAVVDTLLGIFGLRNRSRRRVTETEVIEERRHSSRHGSASRPAAYRRTWFGRSRPVTTVTQEKKSSGGGFFGVFAALAALAACLGLQRRREERKQEYGTASYYSYTESSASKYS